MTKCVQPKASSPAVKFKDSRVAFRSGFAGPESDLIGSGRIFDEVFDSP